jgi:hypothetical protein
MITFEILFGPAQSVQYEFVGLGRSRTELHERGNFDVRTQFTLVPQMVIVSHVQTKTLRLRQTTLRPTAGTVIRASNWTCVRSENSYVLLQGR